MALIHIIIPAIVPGSPTPIPTPSAILSDMLKPPPPPPLFSVPVVPDPVVPVLGDDDMLAVELDCMLSLVVLLVGVDVDLDVVVGVVEEEVMVVREEDKLVGV
jgi:hypothetical protein